MPLANHARRLWSWWYRGAYDQAQLQADSTILQEYEDLCADLGRESAEAKELEPEVRAIRARRQEVSAA